MKVASKSKPNPKRIRGLRTSCKHLLWSRVVLWFYRMVFLVLHANRGAPEWLCSCLIPCLQFPNSPQKIHIWPNSCATISIAVSGLDKETRVSPKFGCVAALTSHSAVLVLISCLQQLMQHLANRAQEAAELWVGHNPKQMLTITETSPSCLSCNNPVVSAVHAHLTSERAQGNGQWLDRGAQLSQPPFMCFFYFVVTRKK